MRAAARDEALGGHVGDVDAHAEGLLDHLAIEGLEYLRHRHQTHRWTRQREGAHLAKDLSARVAVMRRSAAEIQKHAPQVQKRYRDQLIQRLKTAGMEVPGIEDERLVKEIVYFADRSDISEELTRLQSHFQQFEDCLNSREPVGRTLDFLAQEMNREINTIGSKANDSLISRAVVTLKTELEKFREQAQNVE